MSKKLKFRIISLIVSIVFLSTSGQIALAKNGDPKDQSVKTVFLDDHTFYKVVPDDFDLVNASDEKLAAYGLPERPSDPIEKEKWKKEMADLEWVSPTVETFPDDIKVGGSSQLFNNDSTKSTDRVFSTQSSNWCGYIYNSTAFGVTGRIVVPTVYAPSNYRPAGTAQWVGLGGASVGKLAQNGVFEYVSSSGTISYYAFYETIGTDVDPSANYLSNFTVSPGDDVYFITSITPLPSSGIDVSYFFANYTTNKYTNVTVTITSYSGITNTAEWIFERPNTSSGYLYLARPTVSSSYEVNFTNCQYKVAYNTSYILASSGIQCDIYNSSTGNTLATSSSLSSGAFTATWENYN